MKRSTVLGLGLLLMLGSAPAFSHKNSFLPAVTPQTISVIISGPGNPWTSRFGHIDFLLSYGRNLNTNDQMVGFGPPTTEPLQFSRAMGWSKPFYPMMMWRTNLKSRLEEAIKIERHWIRIVPLDLTDLEKQKVIREIESVNSHLAGINYVATNSNCSTVIAEILSKVKNTAIADGARHYPISAQHLYEELGWVKAVHQYSPEQIQAILNGNF